MADPTDASRTGSRPEIGLCADCRYGRVQRNRKGHEFWRCSRADTDERFLRYPPLPVERCHGFGAKGTGS